MESEILREIEKLKARNAELDANNRLLNQKLKKVIKEKEELKKQLAEKQARIYELEHGYQQKLF